FFIKHGSPAKENEMISTARSLMAVALLAGSASLAMAQTARFDYQDDRPLSYGPRQVTQPAAQLRGPVGRDQVNTFDTTDDKAFSYGVRPVSSVRVAAPARGPVGRDQVNAFDATDDKAFSYGARSQN